MSLQVEKGSTAELAGRQVPHQTTTYRVRSGTQYKSVCFTNDLGAEFNDWRLAVKLIFV
jgi:hypothetical protein